MYIRALTLHAQDFGPDGQHAILSELFISGLLSFGSFDEDK